MMRYNLIMLRITLVVASVLALAACETAEPFDPSHCDYEQAEFTTPLAPVDRAEWTDYDGDGVVVLCMWVSDVVVPTTTAPAAPSTVLTGP